MGEFSEADLLRELARRRVASGKVDLDDIEAAAEQTSQRVGEEALVAAVEALPREDATPKPCPRCGRLVPVKARNRVRVVQTVAGPLRVVRNYHHCPHCKAGFYPRDAELKLPENGDVSDAMERRILDFGVNDTFEAAAERWSIHYPFAISSNLVRRVVDRVGERQDRASSELALQCAYRPQTEAPPTSLVIATDGGMLPTREGWKESKVAVIARGEDFRHEKQRGRIEWARYVAEFNQDLFRIGLRAALEAEQADDVMNIVWLGDGARENWKLAEELCPFATQILDHPHAVQNGMVCGKALLGETSDALPSWEQRIRELLDGDSPDALVRELMDCLPYTSADDELAALDTLVRYYRENAVRMKYRTFRAMGLPIGSGMVESAHRHVLQVRMKRAGQRWCPKRARRMSRLRAAYRTAGARAFHRAIRVALAPLPRRAHRGVLPNGARRAKKTYTLHPGSPLNRAASN